MLLAIGGQLVIKTVGIFIELTVQGIQAAVVCRAVGSQEFPTLAGVSGNALIREQDVFSLAQQVETVLRSKLKENLRGQHVIFAGAVAEKLLKPAVERLPKKKVTYKVLLLRLTEGIKAALPAVNAAYKCTPEQTLGIGAVKLSLLLVICPGALDGLSCAGLAWHAQATISLSGSRQD